VGDIQGIADGKSVFPVRGRGSGLLTEKGCGTESWWRIFKVRNRPGVFPETEHQKKRNLILGEVFL